MSKFNIWQIEDPDNKQNYSDLASSITVSNDKYIENIWTGFVDNMKLLLETFLPEFQIINLTKSAGPFYRGRPEEDKGPFYKSKDLMAPPARSCRAGRINPAGLPFLYVADTVDTVLREVHQKSGTVISIGEANPKRNLRILNLTHSIEEEEKANSFRKVINNSFAAPIDYSKPALEYLPTQVVAIYIKDVMGLDGVKYKSSVHEDGYNIVLFNEKNMKITYKCSEVVK